MNDLFDIIKQIKETDLKSILKSLDDNNIQYELLSDKETRPVYILKDFNLVVKIAKNLDATIPMSPLSKNSWTLDNCSSESLFSKNKDNE